MNKHSTPKIDKYAKARADFEEHGVSISAWARENGFTRSLVYEILAGRKKCHRGQSHKIAVLLGLKSGQLADVASFRSIKDFNGKKAA